MLLKVFLTPTIAHFSAFSKCETEREIFVHFLPPSVLWILWLAFASPSLHSYFPRFLFVFITWATKKKLEAVLLKMRFPLNQRPVWSKEFSQSTVAFGANLQGDRSLRKYSAQEARNRGQRRMFFTGGRFFYLLSFYFVFFTSLSSMFAIQVIPTQLGCFPHDPPPTTPFWTQSRLPKNDKKSTSIRKFASQLEIKPQKNCR